MRVLLVEDDQTLRSGLAQVLADAGHEVVSIADGERADTIAASESFDLLVLDLGLPRLDGLDVLTRLRRRRQTMPVLVLSARDKMSDRVRGLDTGADDYLSKPFDLPEFEARVRALLRRGLGTSLRVGNLEWTWEARQGHVDEKALALSRHETVLMESLLKSIGKTVSKSEIARRMGEDGIAAGDNKVEVYVHRVRRKLADCGLEILTVRGLGYTLRPVNSAEQKDA